MKSYVGRELIRMLGQKGIDGIPGIEGIGPPDESKECPKMMRLGEGPPRIYLEQILGFQFNWPTGWMTIIFEHDRCACFPIHDFERTIFPQLKKRGILQKDLKLMELVKLWEDRPIKLKPITPYHDLHKDIPPPPDTMTDGKFGLYNGDGDIEDGWHYGNKDKDRYFWLRMIASRGLEDVEAEHSGLDIPF
jgi:hypothetical protein